MTKETFREELFEHVPKSWNNGREFHVCPCAVRRHKTGQLAYMFPAGHRHCIDECPWGKAPMQDERAKQLPFFQKRNGE